jgi:hypothetical protein
MDIVSLVDTTSLTWILSITYSKLGLGSSSMLPCVVVAPISYLPPPPISFE